MPIREEFRAAQKNLHGLNPVTWGQQQCEAGFSVDVLRPYWLLHYVVKGHGKFEKGNNSYDVSPSQIFVIRPHETHRYIADEHDPWHYMWIAFESDVELPKILGTDVFPAPSAGRIFTDIMPASELERGREEFLAVKHTDLAALHRKEGYAHTVDSIRGRRDQHAIAAKALPLVRGENGADLRGRVVACTLGVIIRKGVHNSAVGQANEVALAAARMLLRCIKEAHSLSNELHFSSLLFEKIT